MDDMDSMLAEIKRQMEEFKSSLTPLMEQNEQIQAEVTNLNSEKNKALQQIHEQYNSKIESALNQQRNISEALSKARTTLSHLEHEAHRIAQEKARKEAEAEAEAKLAAWRIDMLVLEEKWDAMTAGAPWREWAKDHQIAGGKKIMSDRKMILADGMGLGKTLTSLIGCDIAQAATKDATPEDPVGGEEGQVWNQEAKNYVPSIVNGITRPCGVRILYLCPAPLVRNVMREVERWTPHRSPVFLGSIPKAERRFALSMTANMPEFFIVCNYEAWRKDNELRDMLVDLRPDTVIIDEAHNLKDVKSNAYRGVADIINRARPDYVLPMTGTPILNAPLDLYALLSLIDPDRFYSSAQFLNRYCMKISDAGNPHFGKWTFKPGGVESLTKQISAKYLRRTKLDAGIKLPPKTIEVHEIEIDAEAYPEQARARRQMREYGVVALGGEEFTDAKDIHDLLKDEKAISATILLTMFLRLRQIETWPAGIEIRDPETKEIKLKLDVEQSQKMDYMIRWDPTGYDETTGAYVGLLPEVAQEERVVVMSQFIAPLEEGARRAQKAGLRAAVLTGATSQAMRDEISMDFDNKYTYNREDSKYDVLFAHYKVGGVGLNLSAATQMIILDEEWNPGKRDQAYDRIHRLDSDKPVTIHVLRSKPSIDDWLAAIIEQKEAMIGGFDSAMVTAQDVLNAIKGGLI